MSRHVEPMSASSPDEHRRLLECAALRYQLHRETRTRHHGITLSYCECGAVSRTGTCADCLRREIERLEQR